MTAQEAVLSSWALEPFPAAALLVAAAVYGRGWWILRRAVPEHYPLWRAVCFFVGLASLAVSLFSPLDAFASFLLLAHMTQHLLLTMVAPPLLLLGAPQLPLLRGLPRRFASEVLAPFINWHPLATAIHTLLNPVVCWTLFALSNVLWHVPDLYELALRSRTWHEVEHAVFFGTSILFWWHVVQPWPSRPHWPRWAMIPYLLLADLQNTALAAFLSFHGGVLYATYEAAPRLLALSAKDDQAGAGALMWVGGSLSFLIPAGVIAFRFLMPQRGVRPGEARAQATSKLAPKPALPAKEVLRLEAAPLQKGQRVDRDVPAPLETHGRQSRVVDTFRRGARPAARGLDLFQAPGIGPILRWRSLRPCLQVVLLALAGLIVADGLWGPQVSAMNAAGVLPWTHWRTLSVVALLVVGNLFCMACPFVFVRDLGRRFLPAKFAWPKFLRTKWLAVVLLVAYLWAYEAFDLWDWPLATALLILTYFVGALVVDGFFKGASFCQFVCPIGQFHFVQSLASPFEIKIREPSACAACKTHDCLRGNDQQRGCELNLFQPRKHGNMDCTFCLDCVKACPHDNIGFMAVFPGRECAEDPKKSTVGTYAKRPDLAALVLVLTFGAFVNAAGMVSPVLDAMDQIVARFALKSDLLPVTLLVLLALVIAPAGCTLLAARASGGRDHWKQHACRFAVALAPLGFGMWLAHFVFHFFTAALTPLPVASRLLNDVGLRDSPVLWQTPSWAFYDLPALEIFFLNGGFLLCLFLLWRISANILPLVRWRSFLPWAALATALYGLGLWILFQPMEMRGTLLGLN